MAAMLERALDGGVLTLTLNRPDARNALTIELIRDLTEEVVKAAADDSVRCIVLTGRGKAFCAGGDIKQMLERKGKAMETRERLRGGLNPLALALHDIEKPVIARLNGDAVGAGCCLALNGDIVVAAESARIGLTFIRVGLVPDTGGTFNIPRLVGLQKAKLMHFTGDLISAREAESIGLVTIVVPDAELDAKVSSLAARFASMPTRTIGMAKRAFHRALSSDFAQALEFEAYAQGYCFTTEDHAEGVEAFLAKREPKFKGR
ncbi:MAG TPA: enoyl-CoA hydratase [Thermoplasmata archaeon]|nr:enoyl-CoA hydratase [Thermoplasmata archaeon]